MEKISDLIHLKIMHVNAKITALKTDIDVLELEQELGNKLNSEDIEDSHQEIFKLEREKLVLNDLRATIHQIQ